jgi:hypothetical protein
MVFKQQVRIGLNPLRRVFLHLIDRQRLAICALKSLIISMYRCTVQIYSIAVEANMKVELTIDRTKELPKGAVQDAVDLGIATDAETALLLAWKKYRVLINRIKPDDASDISWPEQPA